MKYKLLFFISLCIILSSCSNKDKELEYYQYLFDQLKKTTAILIDDNNKTLEQFDELVIIAPNFSKDFYNNSNCLSASLIHR